MIPQFLGERTNAMFSMEHPTILPGCKGDARMGASLHECPDQRPLVNLSYSASSPDMFALVTSILQQFNEPEAFTDWDSQSTSFPPSWTMDLEDRSRYSSLFPTNIWAPESQTNIFESQSSDKENLGEVSPNEPLCRKCSCPLPGPPCSPPPHEVLKPFDPQNKDLSRQSNIVPGCSNGQKQIYILQRDYSSSQVLAEFHRGHQESIAGGGLEASDTEKSIRLSHPATYEILEPVIQENDLRSERGTWESLQFMSPLFTPPFQQEYSVPEAANTDLKQNQQPNCPDNPCTLVNNVQSKNLRCPLRDSKKRLPPPPPRFQRQHSSYSGDKRLKSRSLNPSEASCVLYKKPIMQMYIQPRESYSQGFVIQPFGSQKAPRRCRSLQDGGFPSGKGNVKLHTSVGCSWADRQAPQEEALGEILRNISFRGWPQHPPTNRFAKCHESDNAPNGGRASQRTGQIESWAKMNPSSVGRDWTPLRALRKKKKMDNSFYLINPSFLHFFPLAKGCSRVPKFLAFHRRPFSPPCPSFSVGVHYNDISRLSHAINDLCGGASASYRPSSPRHRHHRRVTNLSGPAHTLYLHIKACYKQWQMLQKERTKIEADLVRALPGKSFTSSSSITFYQFPANPSQVDHLIWIQFKERARVCILLEKAEDFWGVPIHNNVSASLGRHLEDICTAQARRNDEILKAGSARRPGTSSCISNEKEVLALASALNKLTFSTRKTRTALWCVFQHIVFPNILPRVPGENALDLASNKPRSSQRAKTKKRRA